MGYNYMENIQRMDESFLSGTFEKNYQNNDKKDANGQGFSTLVEEEDTIYEIDEACIQCKKRKK